MERFKTVIGILLAIGIIFGTFGTLATEDVVFGFAWFTNLLWFAIGFPVLFGIGWILFSLMIGGETEMKRKLEK